MVEHDSRDGSRRFGCLQVFGLVVICVLLTAGATFFILKSYLFPSRFKPVTLNPSEEKVLAEKLEGLRPEQSGSQVNGGDTHLKDSEPGPGASPHTLAPEPYSEKGLKREIAFTERELNGLLANNTNLADKLAIDLSDDLISAKLLLPVDEDFPILGGKMLRVRSGVEFAYRNGNPVVILKGVTIMGIPLPNAWLGGLKNIDLVEKFGTEDGFWKTFSNGVEDIRVEEGLLKIKLKP